MLSSPPGFAYVGHNRIKVTSRMDTFLGISSRNKNKEDLNYRERITLSNHNKSHMMQDSL